MNHYDRIISRAKEVADALQSESRKTFFEYAMEPDSEAAREEWQTVLERIEDLREELASLMEHPHKGFQLWMELTERETPEECAEEIRTLQHTFGEHVNAFESLAQRKATDMERCRIIGPLAFAEYEAGEVIRRVEIFPPSLHKSETSVS